MWSKCFTLEWYTFFTNIDMYYITPNVKKLNTIKDVLPNNSTIIFVEQNKIDTRNFVKITISLSLFTGVMIFIMI